MEFQSFFAFHVHSTICFFLFSIGCFVRYCLTLLCIFTKSKEICIGWLLNELPSIIPTFDMCLIQNNKEDQLHWSKMWSMDWSFSNFCIISNIHIKIFRIYFVSKQIFNLQIIFQISLDFLWSVKCGGKPVGEFEGTQK